MNACWCAWYIGAGVVDESRVMSSGRVVGWWVPAGGSYSVKPGWDTVEVLKGPQYRGKQRSLGSDVLVGIGC